MDRKQKAARHERRKAHAKRRDNRYVSDVLETDPSVERLTQLIAEQPTDKKRAHLKALIVNREMLRTAPRKTVMKLVTR